MARRLVSSWFDFVAVATTSSTHWIVTSGFDVPARTVDCLRNQAFKIFSFVSKPQGSSVLHGSLTEEFKGKIIVAIS